jgi:hypothetical protein
MAVVGAIRALRKAKANFDLLAIVKKTVLDINTVRGS